MDKEYVIGQYKSSNFESLRRYLTKKLKEAPQDRFLEILMADVLDSLRQPEKALEYIQNDDGNNDSNYYVLFVKARVYQNTERITEAIPLWNMIISTDLSEIAKSIKSFKIKSAKTIKNDSRYYLAHCLYSIFDDKGALLMTKEHLYNRCKGVYSDFSLKEVRNFKRLLKWNISKPKSSHKGNDGCCTTEQRNKIWKHFESLAEKDMRKAATYLLDKGKIFYGEYYLWAVASEIYYDLNEPLLCLQSAEKAYSIIKDDDLYIVFDYASALAINNLFDDAIDKFNYILNQDINYVAYSEHGEGMMKAKKLIGKTRKMLDWINRKTNVTDKDNP